MPRRERLACSPLQLHFPVPAASKTTHAFEVEVIVYSPKHDSPSMPCRSWKVAGNIQTIRPHETASWRTGLRLRTSANEGTLSSGAISPGRRDARAWRGRGSVRGHECTKRNDVGESRVEKRGQLGNGKAGLSCTRPRHVRHDARAQSRPRRDHSLRRLGLAVLARETPIEHDSLAGGC